MSLPPDDSLAWKVWIGTIVSVVSATVAVAARLLARKISAAPFWWDDWTIIASLVSMPLNQCPPRFTHFRGGSLLLLQAVQWGMGIQRWIILLHYNYGHHAVYVGAHRLMLFQKVIVLQSAGLSYQQGADTF